MRKLGRLSFFVLGLVNVTSFALVALVATVVSPLVPQARRHTLLAGIEVACGMVTVLLGWGVAQYLGTPEALWIPLASLVWFAIHFARLNRVNAFVRASVGMLVGWLML